MPAAVSPRGFVWRYHSHHSRNLRLDRYSAGGSLCTPFKIYLITWCSFLLPSRYCQSDLLGSLANEIVAGIDPAYDQVEAIRNWLYTHLDYHYDTSNASTSAVDTAQSRVGVCRDFVHLGIALCRSLTIPARMVVGYLYQLEPMDLHAWFEAYVGDRWYTFDATQSEPRGNRVAIAYGRDAADVALATQFGPLTLTEMKVWVEAMPL